MNGMTVVSYTGRFPKQADLLLPDLLPVGLLLQDTESRLRSCKNGVEFSYACSRNNTLFFIDISLRDRTYTIRTAVHPDDALSASREMDPAAAFMGSLMEYVRKLEDT